MGQNYNDLSRRALIKLDKDFDQENDAALLKFLTEHPDEYEGVRPIEKTIERVDEIKSMVSSSGSILKNTFVKQAESVLDNVIKTIGAIKDPEIGD